MPPPDAIVTVKLLRIAPLPRGFLIGANRPYVLGKVGNSQAGFFHFGRSRTIALNARSVDLTGEPMLWEHRVPVGRSDTVEVEAEIWDDRGDAAPVLLKTLQERVRPPWLWRAATSVGPLLFLDVNTQLAHNYTVALISRARGSTAASATLRVRRELFVELKEILGLYEPGYPPPVGPGPHKLAGYHAGYLSHDHKGRIYVNRDLTGNWVKNTQLIQVTVEVTPKGMPLPADAKVRWTVLDPDDRFNDATECHREWGSYIDPNDYDASGQPTGALDDDNARAYSETAAATRAQLFDKDPRWEQEGSHTLTVGSDEEALTDIDPATKQSKVKIHCPNIGGTNLILRADVQTATRCTVFPAQTGTMTMWKRVDVQLLKMQGAHSLQNAVRDVPQHLEPACVQLDFHTENALAAAHTRQHMSTSIGTLTSRSLAWLHRGGVFTHRVDKGWFCLAAAQYSLPVPATGGPTGPLFDTAVAGPGTWSITRTGSAERVVVDAVFTISTLTSLRFRWTENVGGVMTTLNAGYIVSRALPNQPSPGKTTLVIWANDITPRFTGHDSDGSVSHATRTRYDFFPRGRYERSTSTWSGTGYNVPGTADLVVNRPGRTGISGISPSVSTGGTRYFAGRTIVFTHHPRYSSIVGGNHVPRGGFDQRVKSTVVHELVHAFGMPHKCGYWDYLTPRQKSCSMNYSMVWLIDPSTNTLVKGTEGNVGDRLCGRHLVEVRRVHLEDNQGLNW